MTMTQSRNRLRVIKIIHTVVWAFFAGCVVAIPFFGWSEMYGPAMVLTAFVLVEVLVLLAYGWRCPLTGVAARYTDDRSDNFDIYLPVWLARHNKLIFGTLFVVGEIVTLVRWMGI